jgi:hypothetical protein
MVPEWKKQPHPLSSLNFLFVHERLKVECSLDEWGGGGYFKFHNMTLLGCNVTGCRKLHLYIFASQPLPDVALASLVAGRNTPVAVFDLSSQQAAVPQVQLRAAAPVAPSLSGSQQVAVPKTRAFACTSAAAIAFSFHESSSFLPG